MIRPAASSHHIERARTVHLAEGILMGLLGCPSDDALATLIEVARDRGVSTYSIASALVSAVGAKGPVNDDDPATIAVLRHWGRLLEARGRAGLVAV